MKPADEKPLAIDLYCGIRGWAAGLLAENWRVVGFDIERHEYGEHRYPAQLVLQDALTLHGSQFKDAQLIVASPPCQAYSYRAMPWSRAKALPPPDNTLFDACFRIQREACEAAGRHIPLIVENVRGAQKWVGRARWNFRSYYLWGDVPALMPITGAGEGRKGIGAGAEWFDGNLCQLPSASPRRKEASAMIAKIPLPLALHIARTFRAALTIACIAAIGVSPSYARSRSVPIEFMAAHPCPGGPDAGHTHGRCRGYIRDHIIALCRGGEDSVRNMQWQTVADAEAKDKWECRR